MMSLKESNLVPISKPDFFAGDFPERDELMGNYAKQVLMQANKSFHEKGETKQAILMLSESRAIAKAMCSAATATRIEGPAMRLLGSIYASLEPPNFDKAIEPFEVAVKCFRDGGEENGGEDEAGARAMLGFMLMQPAVQRVSEGIEHLRAAASFERGRGCQREEAILNQLITALHHDGRHAEAIEPCLRVLDLNRQANDKKSEASTLRRICVLHQATGQAKEAAEYVTTAIDISRAVGDQSAECEGLTMLAAVCAMIAQHQKAIEHASDALAISRSMGDRKLENSSAFTLGTAYLACGQYEKAVEQHSFSLEFAQESGDELNVAKIKSSIATSVGRLGQPARAIEYYLEALPIFSKFGDRRSEASMLGNLAQMYLHMGQYSEAFEHSNTSLIACREVGDQMGEAGALVGLGNVLYSTGKFSEAIQQFSTALSISQALGDRSSEAKCVGCLGNCYNSLAEYVRAIEYHSASLELSRAIGDKYAESIAVGQLGIDHSSLKQYDKGCEYLATAVDLSREIGDQHNLGRSLSALATSLEHAGKGHEAVEQLFAARKISEEAGDQQGVCQNLGKIASILERLSEYEDALEHRLKALSICREIGSRPEEAKQVGNIALLFMHMKDFDKAGELLADGLAINREVGDRNGEFAALFNLGSLELFDRDAPSAALPWLQEALATYDSIWKDLATDEQRISFSEAVNIAYATQIAHFRLQHYTEALLAAEHSRSRAFELLLAQQRTASLSVTPPVDLEEICAVAKRQCTSIVVFSCVQASQLFAWVIRDDGSVSIKHVVVPSDDKSLRQLIELTRRTIGARARQGEQAELRSGTEDAGGTGAAFAKALVTPELDEAALDMAMKAEMPPTKAAVVTPRKANDWTKMSAMPEPQKAKVSMFAMMGCCTARPGRGMNRNDPQRDLEPLGDDVDTADAGSSDSSSQQTTTVLATLLRRCHDLLIAPLELTAGEPLLLVPDQDLYALPFAALQDSDGKFLIELHSLRVTPSIGTAIELEQRAAVRQTPAKASALVVGDPSFGSGWAANLPGARAEAEQVKALLEATDAFENTVTTHVGDEGSKAAVVSAMPGCDVIHLATHGEPGAVLLGGATRAEGELSMAEVHELKLSARLVVLSECDSFRGKLTSDGVIGVTRAFVAAGAMTLVASLWKVDDKATLTLMSHFYKALLADGTVKDPAGALREAMMAMIAEGRWSVLQWAGFVVYGLA